MKKVVIHVGYPKTATTTLQDNVFYELHKLEKINFLGKAFDGKVMTDKIEMVRSLLKALRCDEDSPSPFQVNTNLSSLEEQFCQNEILSVRGLLKSNIVNILSIEGCLFVTPSSGIKLKKMVPKALKTIFDDGKTEIEILISLRTQGKLMQSYYVQAYTEFFAKEKEFDTPSKLFFDHSQALKLKMGEYSEIFDFYNVVSWYSEIFGKENIKILLFEDLINDRDYYISQLAEICDVQGELINFYLENQKPLNVQKRKDGEYVLRNYNYNFFIRMLLRLEKLLKLDKIFPKDFLKSNTPSRNFFKNLFGKKEILEIPELTSDEKKAIFEFYKKSNMLLVDQFGISAEKLTKYKYI